MLESLLKPQTPFESLPFDQIASDQFKASFEQAIKLAENRIHQIEAVTSPHFKNIIEALEVSSLELDMLSGLFFNLYHACTNPEIDQSVGEISEMLAEHSNNVQLSEKLFEKIKLVYESEEAKALNKEQKRLLNETYDGFVRNGALLSPEKKEQLREIDRDMATITPQFSQNLLKATNAFSLNIQDEARVQGLPDSSRESAREEAEKRGEKGWTFTLQAPSYLPFMKYMSDRTLREQMWRAYNSKALDGEFSNRELCAQIAQSRFARAQLLGFKDHADYVLQKRMAKTADQVFSFLEQLKQPSLLTAKKEVQQLQEFANSDLKGSPLQPWDFAYYSEKLKKKLFDLDDEELRPYFPLEQVINGVFLHGEKLYGFEFKKEPSVPTYHPEVEVFSVSKAGQHIGLLYMDLFPRDNKKAGAWMTSFRDQGFDGSKVQRPHISIVCNFTRPTKSNPSLLTFNEVQTLFHEFGHAVHGLSSHCYYRSLGGTNVLWDFVELPSQIMENWNYEKEALALFAKHYQTQEIIPAPLVEKLRASQKFQAGYASLRQLSFSLVDLGWHTDLTGRNLDPVQLEESMTKEVQILPRVEGTNFSVSFSHIFAGGYSAGYYSYKWAEVLEADAFDAFLDEGIFNQEVAERFYQEILSKGGTDDPAVLFKNFRGREPQIEALLKRGGLQ